MGRRLCAAALAVIAVNAQAAVLRTADAMQITIDGIEITPSRYPGYKQARLLGVDDLQATTVNVGAPELPVLRFYVDGDIRIQVRGERRYARLVDAEPLVPVQAPQVKLPDLHPTLVIDKAAYASKVLESEPPYTIEEAGSIRGAKRYLVTLHPFAYAPATGQYRLISQYHIEFLNHSVADVTNREVFAFVVGHHYEHHPDLARYAELKEALGYRVKFIVVAPEDTPQTIRARLQDLYKGYDGERLTQVLIVGDATDVPAYEADHISGITDHYYRAIDTNNYESDINGPDVGVGRLAVASNEQLKVVLDKLTRYQTGNFTNERWLQDVAWLATDDNYQVAEASHNYVITNYAKKHGYQGVFPGNPQQGGDQLYAVTHSVSDNKVNQVLAMGRSIINYSGHGSTTSWAGPNVTQADVRRLSNANALPFVISNACITGDFRVAESFAETWQRHPAGAIAFWGSMDSSYWDEDDILERRLFDGIFRRGFRDFGSATSFALSEHWRHYQGAGKSKYYWETYVLFGDPSLSLRITRSQAIRLQGPSELPVGSKLVNYQVLDADTQQPVSGVRVALSQGHGDYRAVAVSDRDGRIALELANAGRDIGTLSITAAGADTKLLHSELSITASTEPYLTFTGVRTQDRDDGVLYPDTEVQLSLAVTNVGRLPTQGAKVWIEQAQGPVVISNNLLQVPALAARAATRLAGGLSLQVDPAAADGASVQLELAWETNEGQVGKGLIKLRVARPQLRVIGIDFGETDAPSGIRPGSAGDVFLTVRNVGSEVLHAAVVVMTPDRCVSAVDGSLDIPDLAPGAQLRLVAPVNVTIADDCRSGDQASFVIKGHSELGTHEIPLTATATLTAGLVDTLEIAEPNLDQAIPDDDRIDYPLNINTIGSVDDVGIQLKINHSYVGDLRVSLVHPDGTEAVLHNREGGGRDTLFLNLGLGGEAANSLQVFKGKPMAGGWRLRIIDEAASDEGSLVSVRFLVRGYLD